MCSFVHHVCPVQDAAGNSLLHTAVLGPDDLPGYVSALVEAGVAVNAANADHDSALHVAARQGHLQVSGLILVVALCLRQSLCDSLGGELVLVTCRPQRLSRGCT